MIRIKNPNVNSTTRTHPRTLNEAFPRAPEWREHRREMDDEDYMVTIAGLVCLAFVFILAWLGY